MAQLTHSSGPIHIPAALSLPLYWRYSVRKSPNIFTNAFGQPDQRFPCFFFGAFPFPISLILSVNHEKYTNAPNIAHSSRVEEVKAHKFLLALASPFFHQMVYDTPEGCDSSEVMTINVENTSKEAVEKTIYFLYNHPLDLDNVSLATLFHMVDLAERFILPSLRQLLEIHLDSLKSLTTSDIMEAATAVFNLTCFSSSLLDCCAKVLAKNFQDRKAIFDWAGHLVKEKHQQLGMELMARMGKFLTCGNCRSQPCLSGSTVASGAVRVGLKVRSNPDSEYMVNAVDLGVGTVSGKNSAKGWAKVKGEEQMWLGGCKFLLSVANMSSFVYSCEN